jgi:hypothetical protein
VPENHRKRILRAVQNRGPGEDTSCCLVHHYERLPTNHEAMVHLSMILLMTRRLAPTPKTP